MGKWYNIIITQDDFKGVSHEEVVAEENLQKRLLELAPDCNIDWHKVFKDERRRYFKHYMPANKTTSKHSHKDNHILFKEGNNVKVYISERYE